jgi:hypothetical protein
MNETIRAYLLALLLLSPLVAIFWFGWSKAYKWGYRDGQQQMEWAHFDNGCYLDPEGKPDARLYRKMKDS